MITHLLSSPLLDQVMIMLASSLLASGKLRQDMSADGCGFCQGCAHFPPTAMEVGGAQDILQYGVKRFFPAEFHRKN